MQNKNHKLLLIDGNALVHRAYHAIPLGMSTNTGEQTNAVYGFTSSLLSTLQQLKPTFAVCCFDVGGKTFRHDQYESYKAHRKPMEDALIQQIPRIHEVVEALGIKIITKAGFEADDLIGTIAKLADSQTQTYILTGDKDTLQLLSDNVSVITLGSGINKSETITPSVLHAKMGLTPAEVIVYKALRGDPSDNIPGVAGIGEITATKLVQRFHTLDRLYSALERSEDLGVSEKICQSLRDQKKTAYLSEQLATIDVNVKIDFSLYLAKWLGPTESASQLFDQLQFHSLISRLRGLRSGHFESTARNPVSLHVDTGSLTEFEMTGNNIALVFTYDKDTSRTSQISAVALATGADQAYVSKWDDKAKTIIKKILDSDAEIIAPNIKNTINFLQNEGLPLHSPFFDVSLAVALTQSSVDLLPATDSSKLGEFAAKIFQLKKDLAEKIDQAKMSPLWAKIELPLIPVVAKMEKNGVLLDNTVLKKLSRHFEAEINRIEKEIWHLSGQEFNIASPSQLSQILFEKLQINSTGVKKNKTGFATDAETLDSLRHVDPIINLISEFRELSKLKNTYLDVLPGLIDKADGRLHTTFNQLGAATGRFSSADPNLQNIPIRSEYGDEIRQAFVAAKNHQFVAADYSQIELRILAHLSGDAAMIDAFKSNFDIHTATAAKIHQIEPSLVTKELRRAAKTINFGILYGLSAHRLSIQLGITHAEAQQFIDRYFATYPKIKSFLQSVVAQARKDGFYTTIFGRRRRFDDINSPVWAVRASAERMATNFPMQGAVADILKMAMLTVDQHFAQFGEKVKLVLTIHDELVLEVADELVEKVATELPKVMTSVCHLSVPVVAEVKIGRNLGQMTPLDAKN